MKKKATKKRKPKKREEIRCWGIIQANGDLAECVSMYREDCQRHLVLGEQLVELVARRVRR